MYKEKYFKLKLKYLRQYGGVENIGENTCPICTNDDDGYAHRLIELKCCKRRLCLMCYNTICDNYNKEVIKIYSNYDNDKDAESYIKNLAKPKCPYCTSNIDCTQTDHNFANVAVPDVAVAVAVPDVAVQPVILTRDNLLNYGMIDKDNTLSDATYLILRDKNISGIAKDTFNDAPNIKYIDLTGNNISHISQETFKGLENLETLFLHKNPIVEINIIKPNTKKIEIYLEHYIIQTLIKNNPNISDNVRFISL